MLCRSSSTLIMAENDEITKLQAELDAIDRDIAALQIKRQDIESKLKVAQGGTAPPNGAPAVEKSGWQHKYPTACTQFPTIVRVDGKLCAISCVSTRLSLDRCLAHSTNQSNIVHRRLPSQRNQCQRLTVLSRHAGAC